jgi:hypothetical protein
MKLYSGIAIFIILISSCKDKTPPELTINSPTVNQSFHSGDMISITGKTTDKSLHELKITITDDKDSVIYTKLPEVHDLTSYDFNESTNIIVTATKTFKLTITAEDHMEQATAKTVGFVVNP